MFGQPQEEVVDNLSPTELQLTAGRFLINSTETGVRYPFEKVCAYLNNGSPKRAQTYEYLVSWKLNCVGALFFDNRVDKSQIF